MENLKEIRKEKGLSQKELADKVGIEQSALSHLETGRNNPTITTAQALAKALGCTVDDLIREPEAEDADDRN